MKLTHLFSIIIIFASHCAMSMEQIFIEEITSMVPNIDSYNALIKTLDNNEIRDLSQELIKKNEIDVHLLQPYTANLISKRAPINNTQGRLFYFTSDESYKIYFSDKKGGVLLDYGYTCDTVTIKKKGNVQDESFTFARYALIPSSLKVNSTGSFLFKAQDKYLYNAIKNELIKLPEFIQGCCFAPNESLYIVLSKKDGNNQTHTTLHTIPIKDMNSKINQDGLKQGVSITDNIIKITTRTDTVLHDGKNPTNKNETKDKAIIAFEATNNSNKNNVFIKISPEQFFTELKRPDTARLYIDMIERKEVALVSPSNEFCYVEYGYNTIYLYHLNTPDKNAVKLLPRPESSQNDQIDHNGVCWTDDSALLILNSVEKTPEKNRPLFERKTPLYIFINPYSHNGWIVDRKGYWVTISSDGTKAIEEDKGYAYRTTIVDENIKETLAFLNPQNETPQNQLIGIMLLNYIIQKAKSDKQPKAFFACLADLDPRVQEIYNNPDYIPQAIKNILEPLSWSAYFRNITTGIGNKLCEYRKHLLFGAAATAIGIAAAYKFWLNKGK